MFGEGTPSILVFIADPLCMAEEGRLEPLLEMKSFL
jgi:hypothetical protein